MEQSTLTGSCLCDGVRYTVRGEPQRFYHCHCSRCRKATGTGHASNLFVRGTLGWDSGQELIQSYKLPEAARFTNTFCRRCGSRLPRFNEQTGTVFIPAGSLDVEPPMRPQARLFSGSRAAWSCTAHSVPEFDEYAS
ncbi:MAG: GFA family protein [Burkholderiales bacterium]|nr:MAG: GFA family protein [Burkholderiales bacterium]